MDTEQGDSDDIGQQTETFNADPSSTELYIPHHQPALHCMRQQPTPFLQLGLLQQLCPHLYNL